jgi:hypothetical protein
VKANSQLVDSLVSYLKAYDSVVVEATNRKFGHDVFQECADEAETTWKTTRTLSAPDVEVRQ